MTPEQRGYYIHLLAHAWLADVPGTLPNDAGVLWRLAGAESPEMFAQNGAIVLDQFKKNKSGKLLFNERLLQERQAQKRRNLEKSLAGSVGASARWKNKIDGSRIVMPMAENGSAFAFASSSSTATAKSESKPIAQNQGARDLPGFALFWEAYPKKVGKPLARRAWLSKVRDDSRWSEVLAGLEMWKQSDQWQEIQFVPYPATFLNQLRWQDQVPSRGGNSNGKSSTGPGRTERVRTAAERVFGTPGGLVQHLRGELRKGAGGIGSGGVPDRTIGPAKT